MNIEKIRKHRLTSCYLKIISILENYFFHILLFYIRFWMASIFWYSGLTKISNWHSTVSLFKYEYNVPVIAPELAAIMAATTELTTPALLMLGFMTRPAVIPMLCMTAVIEFTYLDLIDHSYWAILLSILLFYGPGKISIDHLIRNKVG